MKVLESDAPLIVYIDVKSPYAFVSIKPTLALEEELGVLFDWRPLTLDIPSYLGSAEKRKGKVVRSEGRSKTAWNTIKYSYMDARRYAERQGYMLKGTEKIWDTSLASIAILWVRQTARKQLPRFFEVVYPAFWRRELDVEDILIVEKCIEKAGVSTNGFREFQSGEGRTVHNELQKQFHANGIYGVPTYVLGKEIFFGRENLPYIRWQLQGRVGPTPDIAYEIDKC